MLLAGRIAAASPALPTLTQPNVCFDVMPVHFANSLQLLAGP